MWRQVAMCAPVIQGYGLTETCAASFIGVPDDMVRRDACAALACAAHYGAGHQHTRQG